MEYANYGDLYQLINTYQDNDLVFDEDNIWAILI
jgi:hypothetical protein